MLDLILAGGLLASDPCFGRGTILLVEAGRHVMSFCEAGHQARAFRIAIGPGGVGKRAEGDAKVPLGQYSLSPAVFSKDYHLFIPVGYPTAAQRKAGYTGGAIGIHGPPRCCRWAASTDIDWTLGCMAVGTDAEIEIVAGWLKAKHVAEVAIELR